MTKKNIIISAGGTGGHIFSALAVTKELQAYYNIIWVGGKTGLENKLVPEHNIPLFTVSILGVRNKGIIRKLLLPLMMLRALYECIKIILKVKPVAVIGFGGYAAFPICLSAKLLGKKIVIHEQNSVIGLTNKLIGKFANKIITAFPNVSNSTNTVMLGNPVRHEITAVYNKDKYLDTSKLRVLIVGGSLGAKVLNEIVPQSLGLIKHKIHSVTHQVGRGDIESTANLYKQSAMVDNVNVVNFIQDMAAAFIDHDIIICRSGASTVAEVACAGIVPIFVPYPFAVDDHQTTNAKYLVDNQAGYLLSQNKLNIDSLSELIASLNKNILREMSEKLYNLAKINSTTMIVEEIRKIVN